MQQTISPTLVVLAAGMGSRYGGLKQMEPVGPAGETILDYSVYDALRAGFGKVVFVIRKEIEQSFRESIGARFEKRLAVEYVFQELDKLPPGFSAPAGRSKPWGTTHAILMAAGRVGEAFAAINADDFYGAEAYRVMGQHLQSDTEEYAMVGFLLRKTLSEFGAVARGVCRVSGDGLLEDIVERTHIEREGAQIRNTDVRGEICELTGDEIVSMNMWGFTPRVFEQLREEFKRFLEGSGASLKSECYLPSTVNALLQSKRAWVRVLRSKDAWFGVTYREDHARVAESIERLIRSGAYPERLWP